MKMRDRRRCIGYMENRKMRPCVDEHQSTKSQRGQTSTFVWSGVLTMDIHLVHYNEGIPSAMHCGYFVLVKMLLCRHYRM